MTTTIYNKILDSIKNEDSSEFRYPYISDDVLLYYDYISDRVILFIDHDIYGIYNNVKEFMDDCKTVDESEQLKAFLYLKGVTEEITNAELFSK